MTSSSTVGQTRITLQFGLDRDIDGAARDVAGGDQRGPRRPADRPAQQPDLSQGQPGRRADPDPGPDLAHADPRPALRCGRNVLLQKLSQLEGVGDVRSSGAALPAVRVELNPRRCSSTASGSRTCAPRSPPPTPTARRAPSRRASRALPALHQRPGEPGRPVSPLVVAYRNGAPVRLSDVAEVAGFGGEPAQRRPRQRQAVRCWSSCTASPAPTSSSTVDRVQGGTAAAAGCAAGRRRHHAAPPTAAPPSAPRCATPRRRC